MTLYIQPKLCVCGCKRPRTSRRYFDNHLCRNKFYRRAISRGLVQHSEIRTCSRPGCGKRFFYYIYQRRRTCSDECANIMTQGGRNKGAEKKMSKIAQVSIGKDWSRADEMRENALRIAKREGIKISNI